MFEHIAPFPIEGFQKINFAMNDDGLVEILKPDDGELYCLKYIIATKYITDIEAVNCIRNIFASLLDITLPLYGLDDIYFWMALEGSIADGIRVINNIQFHYVNLNNYVREAQLIYYGRKKGFQCPEAIRRSIALIGMAYVELTMEQKNFIPLAAEEIAEQNTYYQQGYWEQADLADALPGTATGICRMICDWRREGKTEPEIAALLYDNGRWCSLAQIGALLHNDNSRISADSMKKHASRLLAKPKT